MMESIGRQALVCPKRMGWVSFRLVDEFGNGTVYAGLPFVLHAGYGEVPQGGLDQDGYYLLYVNTPASRPWNGKYSDTSLHHEWYLRVQARVELPEDTWVFPAPAPKIPLRNAASQAFSAQPEVFYRITAAQDL